MQKLHIRETWCPSLLTSTGTKHTRVMHTYMQAKHLNAYICLIKQINLLKKVLKREKNLKKMTYLILFEKSANIIPFLKNNIFYTQKKGKYGLRRKMSAYFKLAVYYFWNTEIIITVWWDVQHELSCLCPCYCTRINSLKCGYRFGYFLKSGWFFP